MSCSTRRSCRLREQRRRGQVTADDRALDRSRQPGVDPVAGEARARATGVSTPGRAGWPGASENVARCSRTTVRAASTRVPRAGNAPRRLRARRARSASSLSAPTSASAPLETSDRCDAASPNTCRLSNTHCISRPGRPTNSVVHHRAVEPEIHRHDRRRGHPRGRARRSAPAARRRPTRSGRARTTARRRRPPGSPAARRGPRRRRPVRPRSCTRARALTRTSPPVLSMIARAGSAYISCSGSSRQHERRVARGSGRTSRPARARTAPRPPRPATGSAPRAPAAPTATRAAARVWPCRISQLVDGLVRRARPAPSPALELAGARAAAAPPSAARCSRSRQRQRVPVEARRRRRCSGGGSAGQRSTRSPARASIIGTSSDGCMRTLPCGADPAQERERLAVAAEQHVLAVVDELAGLAIDERGRAAAQPRRGLEHEHARAPLRPAPSPRSARRSRRRSRRRRSCAGHDDQRPISGVFAQVVAAISARRGRGTRITLAEDVVVARPRSARRMSQ